MEHRVLNLSRDWIEAHRQLIPTSEPRWALATTTFVILIRLYNDHDLFLLPLTPILCGNSLNSPVCSSTMPNGSILPMIA